MAKRLGYHNMTFICADVCGRTSREKTSPL